MKAPPSGRECAEYSPVSTARRDVSLYDWMRERTHWRVIFIARACARYLTRLRSVARYAHCPTRVWWRGILDIADLARYFFADVSPRNVNRTIKMVFGNMGIPSPPSTPRPHGFRRGDAKDLTERGAQWSSVAGSVGWRSLAFRGTWIPRTTCPELWIICLSMISAREGGDE